MGRSQRPYAIYARPEKKKNTYRFYVRFRGQDGRSAQSVALSLLLSGPNSSLDSCEAPVRSYSCYYH
jgi:hypothetical protein